MSVKIKAMTILGGAAVGAGLLLAPMASAEPGENGNDQSGIIHNQIGPQNLGSLTSGYAKSTRGPDIGQGVKDRLGVPTGPANGTKPAS